ncbi:putative cytochrome P450 [Stipitochalara longipes BDJ]|nr:putative cytochrome P450 [Stipitochalara longipes BDJ]
MATFLEDLSPVTKGIASSLFLYIIYWTVQYSIKLRRQNAIIRQKGCKPVRSYPHRDPILGLDIFLENAKLGKTGGLWDRARERYLSLNTWTFSQLLLGDRIINTTEPENIKAILATQFHEFELPPRRKNEFQPVLGHGIFTTDGKEWEASRALLRPNFVRNQVGDLNTFDHHISAMISHIPKDGSTVDLQALFFMLTIDNATEFLFGTSSAVLDGGIASERGSKFAEAFTYATERIGTYARLGKLASIFPDKHFTNSVAYVHEYVHDYVQKAVDLHKTAAPSEKVDEKDSSRYVFLEHLAKAGYSEKKIQDELLNILLAGRDTTASLLSYLFYILARRPDVFSKLRTEIMALGKDLPTFEQIKGLKYLQYCLNETLRLYPVVPGNSRTAVVDTTLPVGGGPDGKSPIFVKAGQQVNYQVYVMHRRKDLYGEDALEFKPERWEKLRPSWQFLPFNGGPRICIGQQFALTEASFTTIRILQAFKNIEARDNAPLTELMTLTAAVRGGVNVGMTTA